MNIKTEVTNSQLSVIINRPSAKNAFDLSTIDELYEIFTNSSQDKAIKSLLLTGSGEVFSAGADLHMMKDSINDDFATNKTHALKLALMIKSLAQYPKPVICLVNGPALGGAIGLIAASDIVIALEVSYLCLSEVKLGLIPAVISPFIINAMGTRQAGRFFFGEKITANKAKEIGLYHEVLPKQDVEIYLAKLTKHINSLAPEAVIEAKRLCYEYEYKDNLSDKKLTSLAENIARIRIKSEAQEGIRAFFAKEKPAW